MGKIRGNPQAIALAHETRANLYHHLGTKEEMPTVELEKILQITRYHLYHHLKQLAKVGLIENHRDVGRAKWWRLKQVVSAPIGKVSSSTTESQAWINELPAEMITMLEQGAKVKFVPVPKNASDSINAKKMLETIAKQHGFEIDIPFTFVPGGILLISQPR